MTKQRNGRVRVLASGWALAAASLALAVLASCGDDNKEPGESAAERCFRTCFESEPAGAELFGAWGMCMDNACGHLDPETEEGGQCFFDAFSPTAATAPCRAETQACFTGPIQGCRELLDSAAQECEPATLPMTEEMLDGVAWCLISHGWQAGAEAQALAWSLLNCAFPLDGSPGCVESCMDGAAACRACAETTCAAQYTACTDHTATAGAALTPEQASCQRIMTCQTGCGE
jgi:hypothetical protein